MPGPAGIRYHLALMSDHDPCQASPPAPARAASAMGLPSVPSAGGGSALAKLRSATTRRASFLSAGLEPCPSHLPRGFAPDIEGYERFLSCVVEATRGVVAAYKLNLAFFEALGPRGIDLLYRVRAALPSDTLVIADAKRGDIGTTAEHYARALYERLGADAATVNPLMGRDSAEPFLAHADKLTFFLALTSNPGATDFLVPGGLYRRIAEAVVSWNTRGNAALVVGATHPGLVGELRRAAPDLPFLVPGIGAQGGELEATARQGIAARGWPAMLFHVTRGLLPLAGEPGDPADLIRARAQEWRSRINRALVPAPTPEGDGPDARR